MVDNVRMRSTLGISVAVPIPDSSLQWLQVGPKAEAKALGTGNNTPFILHPLIYSNEIPVETFPDSCRAV